MSSFIPGSSFVVDTMAVVLHLEKRRTGQRVKAILDASLRGEVTVFLPGVVFAEILYLSENEEDYRNPARGTPSPQSKSYYRRVSTHICCRFGCVRNY